MRRLLPMLLLLLPLTARAADPAARDITRFVTRALGEFPDVPSLGIAVVRDGKPYFVHSFGFRDVERKLKADENTVYYIASSTKSYTGLLASLLAARRVIDLDAPVTRYLPETKLPARVTLRTLLTHTAGIKNDAVVFRTAYTGEHTPAQLIEILSHSSTIEPKFQYDNLGYVVTALALDRVTGKKWQDLLRDEIFKPLGMTRTSAYISAAQGWPLAKPYDSGAFLQKTDRTMHAAGGIITTPIDLAKWLAANINRTTLPAAAYAEAQKAQVPAEATRANFKASGYGFGWYAAKYEESRVLFHMGGYDGWRAHVSFMPDEKIGVAVVTNTGRPGAVVRDLVADYIYDRLRGKSDEATYIARLERLKADTQAGIERRRFEDEARRSRPPSLTRDLSVYEGVYAGPTFGEISVKRTPEGLEAAMGPLRAKLEPFTEPESARVELVPGSGEVLRFVVEGEKAVALKYNGETLARK